jgi:hypothetical protein
MFNHQVPEGDYEVELGIGRIAKVGSDVTIVAWGNQMNVLKKVLIEALLIFIHNYCLHRQVIWQKPSEYHVS